MLLFLGVVFLNLQSCKKDDDAPITLIGKWKRITGTYSPAFLGTTDYFSSYDACVKDNITEFKSNGTAEYTEGAIKCDPDDDQIIDTIGYTYTSTTFTSDGDIFNYTINGSTLTFTNTFTSEGTTYTNTSSFQRQ